VAQKVECLSCKCKALNSNPSTAKKVKKKFPVLPAYYDCEN
jgi:hypothetical protein